MGNCPMSHLTEEEITMAYYDELAPDLRRHIDECEVCRSSFVRLQDLLNGIREYGMPRRADSYGGEVWARLAPTLPRNQSDGQTSTHGRRRGWWLRWWVAAPAFAALVAAVFFSGLFTRRNPAVFSGISPRSSERVLLMSLGDHLDRSQIVLAELANASPGTIDVTEERAAARDLLNENRLFRQTASRAGDPSQTALLDELERVLLDIANGPSTMSSQDLEALQQRVENNGLLFKVRIAGSNVLEKGQKL